MATSSEQTGKKRFEFVSQAPGLLQNTFSVVNFQGSEGLSACYQFEIMLVADDPEIDLDAVLHSPATFSILRDDNNGNIPFHGILAQFEQLHEVDNHVFYRAVLVPRLWLLSLNRCNQIFLDKSVSEILEAVLKDGELTADDDYELKFKTDYSKPTEKREYVCQYGESHLDFISRWMEREGMYYFFEQTADREKLIITDTHLTHTSLFSNRADEGDPIVYSPPSGMAEPFREEIVHALVCKQKRLPRTLHVKDYNYRKPNMDYAAKAEVSPKGQGEVHIYDEHFFKHKECQADAGNGAQKYTDKRAKTHAVIRAQELLSHETRFHGESTIPYLRPGYFFELNKHYRQSFNQTYLAIEMEHTGSQSGFLVAGLQQDLADIEKQLYYRNSFVAIPKLTSGEKPVAVQYRPPLKTEKPRFYGTLQAKIDASGSGEQAELDDQGRYKVRLPFDINAKDREDGKASAFIRMMQPYAEIKEGGVHFPLRKGTDVYLSFENGDPDRPVIVGAAPNPITPSPVTSANPNQSVMRDHFGNELVFDATPGDEHIRLFSPHHKSGLVLGKSIKKFTDSDTWNLKKGNTISTGLGTKLDLFAGFNTKAIGGLAFDLFAGLKYGLKIGGIHDINLSYDHKFVKGSKKTVSAENTQSVAMKNNVLCAGEGFYLTGAAKASDTYKPILFGNEDAIIFSLGKKFEGGGGKAYKFDDPTEGPESSPYFALVASIFATLAAMDWDGEFSTDIDTEQMISGGTISIGVILSIVTAIIINIKINKNKEEASKKLEQVKHKNPPIKIEMKKDDGISLECYVPEPPPPPQLLDEEFIIEPPPQAPDMPGLDEATIVGSKIQTRSDGIQMTFIGNEGKSSKIEIKDGITIERIISDDQKGTVTISQDGNNILIDGGTTVELKVAGRSGVEVTEKEVKILGKAININSDMFRSRNFSVQL